MASTPALIALCVLAAAALLLLRKHESLRRGGRLDVVETSRLGPNAAVAVVRAGRRYFLIASASSAVTNVAELDARDWADQPAQAVVPTDHAAAASARGV